MTSLSIRCEPLNRSAPCTTRWPMAWMSARPLMPAIFVSGAVTHLMTCASAALWSRSGAAPLHRRLVAHLEGDDGLAADPLDQALGELPVGVLLDQVGVGFDDLELEGGTAAVEDEYVHDGILSLRGQVSDSLF